jgi:hypothetical protein
MSCQAKIDQNVNKAVYFFARFFRVNLVVYFYSIPPTGKYTSALLFWGINSSSERHRELFFFGELIHHQSITENFLLDAEIY